MTSRCLNIFKTCCCCVFVFHLQMLCLNWVLLFYAFYPEIGVMIYSHSASTFWLSLWWINKYSEMRHELFFRLYYLHSNTWYGLDSSLLYLYNWQRVYFLFSLYHKFLFQFHFFFFVAYGSKQHLSVNKGSCSLMNLKLYRSHQTLSFTEALKTLVHFKSNAQAEQRGILKPL